MISDCFNKYSSSHLQANVCFSLLLFCHGKGLYSTGKKQYPLHRAVFDGNLPLASRLVSCQHDGVIYCDKNELDSCGNTPLTLAIKQRNLDAVKILTDLFCSAKLNPIKEIFSGF